MLYRFDLHVPSDVGFKTVVVAPCAAPQTFEAFEESPFLQNEMGSAAMKALSLLSSPHNVSVEIPPSVPKDKIEEFKVEAARFRLRALRVLQRWTTWCVDDPHTLVLLNKGFDAAHDTFSVLSEDEWMLFERFPFAKKVAETASSVVRLSGKAGDWLQELSDSYEKKASLIPEGSAPFLLPVFRSPLTVWAEIATTALLETLTWKTDPFTQAHPDKFTLLSKKWFRVERRSEDNSFEVRVAFSLMYDPEKSAPLEDAKLSALCNYSLVSTVEPDTRLHNVLACVGAIYQSFATYASKQPDVLRFDDE